MNRTAQAASERPPPRAGSHHQASAAIATLSASSPATPDRTNGCTPAARPSRSITPARHVPMPTWAAVSAPSAIHAARGRGSVMSHEHVVAELEQASAGEPLDALRQIETEVLELEVSGSEAPLRIVAPLGDPRRGDAWMRARERLEQRDPVQVALGLLARRALATPGVDGLGDLVFLADRARGPGPSVVKHLGAGASRADLPVPRADAEPLRALVGTDVAPQADGPHLAPIPAAAGRDELEPGVEVPVVDEQPLDALVAIPLADSFLQEPGARLMQHFVGLDVDAPVPPAGVHGLERLDREHFVFLREVPLAVEDLDARVGDRGDDVARPVVRAAHVDDDLVAHLEHRADGRHDREVQRDRVADDGEAGEHRPSGPELQVVEPAVQAVGGEQLGVGATLPEAPVLEHHDQIGVLDGREPVRDHEHRAVPHEAIDRVLNEPLRLGVELAGGLVEDEDRRVAQHGARDREWVALAAGEPRAALAEEIGRASCRERAWRAGGGGALE